MSNKEYRIDGRDPNAKGYVKEDRMANQHETDKIVEALESFGYKNVEDYKFHLFGRLDDVHGWYLFGISKEDDYREDFLILDDCLDVLEGPTYNKVVGLDDVMHYARTEGSGDNVGTAYDAMQEWGVFNSLSQGFCDMMDSIDVCIENERAHWDGKRKEWKLSFDVMFNTDMGGNEMVKITIPAQFGNSNASDREFVSEWKGECAAYNVEERYEDFIDDCEVTADEAMQWAESKARAMYKIYMKISNYLLDRRKVPDDDDEIVESRERVENDMIWVLTIRELGKYYPELHETFEGAVEGARKHFMSSTDVTDEDWKKVKSKLEEHLCFYCEDNDCEYDLTECPVCK